jgi:hypothetical protein
MLRQERKLTSEHCEVCTLQDTIFATFCTRFIQTAATLFSVAQVTAPKIGSLQIREVSFLILRLISYYKKAENICYLVSTWKGIYLIAAPITLSFHAQISVKKILRKAHFRKKYNMKCSCYKLLYIDDKI